MKFNTRVTPREIESSITPRIVYQETQILYSNIICSLLTKNNLNLKAHLRFNYKFIELWSTQQGNDSFSIHLAFPTNFPNTTYN
jgi:hypothetical protein